MSVKYMVEFSDRDSSLMLDPPVDESSISDAITRFDDQPVDDMNEWDLSGTVFYRNPDLETKAVVRRWFLVDLHKLESESYQAKVEVHDQLFVGPGALSPAGPTAKTAVQSLEKELEKPDYDPVTPWASGKAREWLSEWDEEDSPEFPL